MNEYIEYMHFKLLPYHEKAADYFNIPKNYPTILSNWNVEQFDKGLAILDGNINSNYWRFYFFKKQIELQRYVSKDIGSLIQEYSKLLCYTPCVSYLDPTYLHFKKTKNSFVYALERIDPTKHMFYLYKKEGSKLTIVATSHQMQTLWLLKDQIMLHKECDITVHTKDYYKQCGYKRVPVKLPFYLRESLPNKRRLICIDLLKKV